MKTGVLKRLTAFLMTFLMTVSAFAPNGAMNVRAEGVQADETDGVAAFTEKPAAVTGLSFNGVSQNLVTAGTAVNSKIVYAVVSDNTTPAVEAFDYVVPSKTNAGKYYVWFALSANVATTKEHVEVEIGKTALSANQIVAKQDAFVYDGTEKTFEFSLKVGEYELEEGADYTVDAKSALKATASGNYVVSINGIGENFKGKVEKTWSIGAAEDVDAPAEVETAPVAKSVSYNGAAQELVTEGKAKVGTMYYAVSSNDAAPADGWTTDVPKATDAGNYVVWYKAANKVSETTPVSVNAAIAKADIKLEGAPEDGAKLTLVYTGKEQALLPEIKVPAGAEVQYSTTGTSFNAVVPVATDRADYTVYYKVDGGKNYNDVAARKVIVTIALGANDQAVVLAGLGKDASDIEIVLTAPAESVSYNGKKHVNAADELSAKKQKTMANDLKIGIIGLEDYAELYKVSYTYKNNVNASTDAKPAQYNIQLKVNKKAAAYTSLDKKAKKALTKAVKAANKKLKKEAVVKFQIGAANLGTFALDNVADKAMTFKDAAGNTITVNFNKKATKVKNVKVAFGTKKLTATKKQIARSFENGVLTLTGNGNYTGKIVAEKK